MGPRRDWRGYAALRNLHAKVEQASMGPRRDWRGYQAARDPGEGPGRLQWGHAVIGVDTVAKHRDGVGPSAASMGPRRDWRGYTITLIGRLGRDPASMGPRRDWRGYMPSTSRWPT